MSIDKIIQLYQLYLRTEGPKSAYDLAWPSMFSN